MITGEEQEKIIAEIADQIRSGRCFLFLSLDPGDKPFNTFGLRTNLNPGDWKCFAATVIKMAHDARQMGNN